MKSLIVRKQMNLHRANRQPWVISLELSEFLAIFAGNEARQNRDKRMTAFGSNDE